MGTEYLFDNPNFFTKQELSQRAAANQVYAALNPNSSYAGTAQQMGQNYADILNHWTDISNSINGTGNSSNSMFADGIDAAKFVLSGINAWQNYKLGKDTLNFNKEAFYQQQANWNEKYNKALKEYNETLASRLRQRAAFETGNQTAYNDEIAANSMRRGETGNSSADYLNYKFSSYSNPTTTTTTSNAAATAPSTVANKTTI